MPTYTVPDFNLISTKEIFIPEQKSNELTFMGAYGDAGNASLMPAYNICHFADRDTALPFPALFQD